MRPTRVVIVDDHEIVRVGLSTLLAREPDIDVVGMAANGEDGIELLDALRPDVAVVDYSLPRMTGVEVCAVVTLRFPEVAVVLLTTFLSDNVVLGALEAGARAYVCKDVDATDLKKAIRAVARGDAVLDPKVAGRVARWANRRRVASHEDALSAREIDVLRLVSRGHSNRDIAAALFVSENTVKTYLKRVLTKLDCHSRSEASAIAAQRGLL